MKMVRAHQHVPQRGKAMIENGKQVAIEYSVFADDNTPIDSNVGKDPLIFLFGSQQILPALEEALRGLEVGDSKQVTLAPEHAYGDINPHAYKKVDAKLIPEDLRFEGALLVVADEQFGEMLIRVDSLGGGQVVLDLNHPLAGKTLNFDVKVLDIS
ncbi:putative FKBP-type 16 kDa peptidyl-prolyl cis-trans isomerase [Candidatus Neptunochlamydia vexilliferae]|uniref:Peptidyl-prolyl cis-trans isomerase n=2 Tax=Candidatus Neptunichlamydia vexilliferae TaxID=1651774 RepID=A0ABS0B0J5_9BACT|nr:putative FKBP-type 16 kDa peptidyl-prolyl cis-trans isomerase [Candidatus Neptunochlamydia vexilliferae]